MSKDQKTIAKVLSRTDLRKRYPGFPRVKGLHFGLWAYRGRGVFEGEIAGKELLAVHRHKELAFPEADFAELEAKGFEFVRWAAA